MLDMYNEEGRQEGLIRPSKFDTTKPFSRWQYFQEIKSGTIPAPVVEDPW